MRIFLAVVLSILIFDSQAYAINEKQRTYVCISFDPDVSCGEGDGSGRSGGFSLDSGLGPRTLPRGGGGGGIGGGGSFNPDGTLRTDSNGGRPGFIYDGNSNAPETKVSTVVYTVTGTTAAELNAQLRSRLRNGWAARTFIPPKEPYKYGYSRAWAGKTNTFVIDTIDIRIPIKKVIPQWKPEDRKKAPKCLQRQVARLIKLLSAHEDHHVDAFKRLEARVFKRMRELGPFQTAVIMNEHFNAVLKQEAEAIQAEEDAWDIQPGNYPPELAACSD